MTVQMPGLRAWNKEESQYLRANYGLMPDEEIAQNLSRPLKSLATRARRMGVSKNDNRLAKRLLEQGEGPSVASPEQRAPLVALWHGQAPYLCPELARSSGRPGSMDAFALPSRVGNGLSYPALA